MIVLQIEHPVQSFLKNGKRFSKVILSTGKNLEFVDIEFSVLLTSRRTSL